MTRAPGAAARHAVPVPALLFTTARLRCRRDGRPITRAECEKWLEVAAANDASGLRPSDPRREEDGSLTQVYVWRAPQSP